MNKSTVQNVRVVTKKSSGGTMEIFLLEILEDNIGKCLIKSSDKKKINKIYNLDIFDFEKSVLSKLNVNIHSLCTWKDIISVLEKRKKFGQTEIENLKEFLSRPDDWREKNA